IDDLSPRLGPRWRRVGVDERQALTDPVEAGLNGRVAHAIDALHLLDRAMGAHERRDEDLILQAQLGELGELKLAFDHDASGEPDAFDDESFALSEVGQVLPVHPYLLPSDRT